MKKKGKKAARHAKRSKSHPKTKLMVWAFAFFIWMFVIVVALGFMGMDESVRELSQLDFKWVAAAFVTFLFSLVVYGLNWTMLIRFLKMPVRIGTVFKAMMIGLFVDNILPTIAPGGEFMMGYLIHRDSGEPLSKALASVVIQMVSWFVGFIAFAVVIISMLLYMGAISFELMVAVTFFLIIFSAILGVIVYLAIDLKACEKFILVFSGKIFAIATIFTKKRFDERGKQWIIKVIREFHHSIASFAVRKWVIVFSCANLAFHHFLAALSLFFVVLAFNVYLPFELVALLLVLTVLSSMLTFLPGGIGAFEIVGITLLSFETSVITATLILGVYRLIQYWFVVFAGGFLALGEGLETLEAGV
jgi:uncharacterized protein (TIRG00374 family)